MNIPHEFDWETTVGRVGFFFSTLGYTTSRTFTYIHMHMYVCVYVCMSFMYYRMYACITACIIVCMFYRYFCIEQAASRLKLREMMSLNIPSLPLLPAITAFQV